LGPDDISYYFALGDLQEQLPSLVFINCHVLQVVTDHWKGFAGPLWGRIR